MKTVRILVHDIYYNIVVPDKTTVMDIKRRYATDTFSMDDMEVLLSAEKRIANDDEIVQSRWQIHIVQPTHHHTVVLPNRYEIQGNGRTTIMLSNDIFPGLPCIMFHDETGRVYEMNQRIDAVRVYAIIPESKYHEYISNRTETYPLLHKIRRRTFTNDKSGAIPIYNDGYRFRNADAILSESK